MGQARATDPIAAINAACHCGLVEFILIGVALVILTGIRAWRRRDKSIHGALLALRFGLAWSAALVAIGVSLWLHEPDLGPFDRQQLAVRAGSICTDDLNARLGDLNAADPDPIAAGDRADSQAADDLRQLTPTAAVARDWRRFVNGFVAYVHSLDSPDSGPDPGRKAERKGQAAETRLGIDCRVY